AALFHPVLPAPEPGFPDRRAAVLHHPGQSQPLSRGDHRAGLPGRTAARDQAEVAVAAHAIQKNTAAIRSSASTLPQWAVALWISVALYTIRRLKRLGMRTSSTKLPGGTKRLPSACTRLSCGLFTVLPPSCPFGRRWR